MKCVAQHLYAEALNRSTVDERDLFARSGFSRYYYAYFLTARALWRQIKGNPTNIAHTDLPNALERTAKKLLLQELAQARKSKYITRSDHDRFKASVEGSVKALASILRTANGVRVVADYYPDIKISFVTGTPTLQGTSQKDVTTWMRQVESSCQRIQIVRQQLGH